MSARKLFTTSMVVCETCGPLLVAAYERGGSPMRAIHDLCNQCRELEKLSDDGFPREAPTESQAQSLPPCKKCGLEFDSPIHGPEDQGPTLKHEYRSWV